MNDAILLAVRLFVLASLLATASWGMASNASAQGGEVYVPPGYGDGSATVVIPATTPPSTTPTTSPEGYVVPGTTYAASGTVALSTPTPHMETRTRETSIRELWIPGLIALPASWLLTWTIASTALPLYGDAIEMSYIPVIGPWLMLTQPLNGYEGFAVAMGIVQDVAAIMLILGLVLRETVEEQVWVMADLGEGRRLTFDASAGPGSAMTTTTLTF